MRNYLAWTVMDIIKNKTMTSTAANVAKWNTQALLLGIYKGAATLESSLVVLQMTKCKLEFGINIYEMYFNKEKLNYI